jgi:hypothetical protein
MRAYLVPSFIIFIQISSTFAGQISEVKSDIFALQSDIDKLEGN